jgi:hypothetical protein
VGKDLSGKYPRIQERGGSFTYVVVHQKFREERHQGKENINADES